MLDDLVAVIETLKGRMEAHRLSLQVNETRTRTALIDPLLTVLGWDVANPNLVTPEYEVSGKRADYALLAANGRPAAILEAKKLGESLVSHRTQMVGYCVEFGIPYAGLTDGDRWELYDVFMQTPLNGKRLLDASIQNLPVHQCAMKLLLLWRANLSSSRMEEVAPPTVTVADPSPALIPTPPDGNWTSLSTFQTPDGNDTPPAVRFPSGQESSPRNWNALLVELAEWLVRNNALADENCPIRLGSTRYMVHTQPTHSNATPFAQPRNLSNGLVVEANLTAAEVIRACCSLMTQLGQDPSTVQLKVA